MVTHQDFIQRVYYYDERKKILTQFLAWNPNSVVSLPQQSDISVTSIWNDILLDLINTAESNQ